MAGYLGNIPSAVPLSSADLADGIITSAKIADGAIVNADINASAAIAGTKISGSFGKVLQVVNSSTSSTNGFSHDTIVSVASVSITPSSASSKIYVTTRGTVQGYDYNAGDSNLYLEYYIFRDSTEVLKQQIRTADASTNSFMANTTNTSTSFLDSPSTTSAISYSIRVKVISETSNTGDFSNGGIIAMEIGA
jgi:hypothetical protein